MSENANDNNQLPYYENKDISFDSAVPPSSHEDVFESSPQVNCFECLDIGFTFEQSADMYLNANTCSCDIGKELSWKSRNKKGLEFPDFVESIRIPNLFLDRIQNDSFDKRVKDWILEYIGSKKKNNALFLTGGTGTGKTASACGAISILLKIKKLDTDCLMISCQSILDHNALSEGKKKCNTFTEYSKRDTRKAINDYNLLMSRIKSCELLILDELGQERINQKDQSIIFDIIDQRITSCKPTIFISNHAFDKDQSLGKSTIDKFLGERILSRLKSCSHIHFSGEDKRNGIQSVPIISEKEQDEYMFPQPVLSQDDNDHHIMTWLTRNPAFESLSTRNRKKLTDFCEGEERDLPRPSPDVYKDVWVKGDRLIVQGPICDHEDKKLYATLLKLLAKSHESGNLGLTLEVGLKEILRHCGLSQTGPNVNSLKRRIIRLTQMSMDFNNSKGSRWIGPLINDVMFVNTKSREKTRIEFNKFMISFYKLHAYTTFNKSTSKALKGDSSAFYLFYSSHSKNEMCITVDKCKILLGISKDFDKKEARKRVRKAVENLITSGVMNRDKTFVKGNKVYTCLAPANLAPS